MKTSTISILIDDKAAQLYEAAPAEKREQLRQLISYLVEEFADSTPASLFALMDEMSREASEKGLTSEILDSILRDE
jgi:hypothetical protein